VRPRGGRRRARGGDELGAEARGLGGESSAALSGWISWAREKSFASSSTLLGSGTQQSTGQTSAHCSVSWKPTHSVQSFGSIWKVSSPSLIASFGHSGSQAPQLMHSSVIIVAIGFVLSRPQERARRGD
jgi:hypothetical protein